MSAAPPAVAALPRLRPAAREDIEAIAAHYRADSGIGIALAFTDALQRALVHLAHNPTAGGPTLAQALDMPALRTWPLARFPQVLFYLETPRRIDVLRVLHAKRDMPARLRLQGSAQGA